MAPCKLCPLCKLVSVLDRDGQTGWRLVFPLSDRLRGGNSSLWKAVVVATWCQLASARTQHGWSDRRISLRLTLCLSWMIVRLTTLFARGRLHWSAPRGRHRAEYARRPVPSRQRYKEAS